jgi:hypothetical protein
MGNRKIAAFLRRSFGPTFTLAEIAGDASTRKFYRVRAGRRSAVLIDHLQPLDPSAPFFSNLRVLRTIGAPVPRMISHGRTAGFVLVEDCGDVTLQRHLAATRPRTATDSTRRLLYRQACDLIVLLQEKGAGALRPDDFGARNALDRERFLFELDHFHRHFLLGLRESSPDEAEVAVLRDFYGHLAAACDRLRRVYCHRDFQARNLMVQRGRLRLIDFQDARMGPYTYDAASLLRDSSLDLPEDLVQEMATYLARRLGEAEAEFRRDMDLMALQRNIKDLGTFGYMATIRGRPDYLAYVPRTLRYIRRTLLRTPIFHDHYPVLERFILTPA